MKLYKKFLAVLLFALIGISLLLRRETPNEKN